MESELHRGGDGRAGKLCSAVNSIMITHMDSVLGMFYNKRLAEECQLPDLYELVRSGGWTFGKYFELTRDVTRDLNGDSEYNDNDQYAFVGLDGILRLGSGVKLEYAVKDENDYPKLNLEDEGLLSDIGQLRDWAQLYANEIYDPRTDKNTGGDGDKAVFPDVSKRSSVVFSTRRRFGADVPRYEKRFWRDPDA